MTRSRPILLLVAAVACNEVLGLEPGRLGSSGGGSAGISGSPNQGGSAGSTSGTSAGGASAMGGGGGARAGVAGQSGASGAGMGGEAGAAPDCTSREECRQQGHEPPHLCLGGKCVDAKTSDCSLLIGGGDLEEEPVLFGAFARFDPLLVGNYPFYWNLVLAVSEFNERGGIPIGRKRRVLLVLCHGPNDVSVTSMERSVDHLVERLGIPSILMLTSVGDLEIAAGRAFLQGQNVFMLHSNGATQRLLDLDDDGRVWHMLGSVTDMAPAYVPLVERVEVLINSGAPAGAVRPNRLVMAVPFGEDFRELENQLDGILRINGRPVADQIGEGNYLRLYQRGTLQEEAARIAEFEPDIVVNFIGGSSSLLPMIDEEMRARGAPPPFYVLSFAASHSTPLESTVRADSDLRRRIVGANFAGATDSSVYDEYLARLRLLAPQVPNLEGTENYYDAAYFLLVSAAAASHDLPLDGRKIADGMKRLTQGARYDIGPGAGIDHIFDRLTSDPEATLSLHGTLGAPEFDTRTGARISDASVWCFDQDANFVYDALRYNRVTRELEEYFPCFDR